LSVRGNGKYFTAQHNAREMVSDEIVMIANIKLKIIQTKCEGSATIICEGDKQSKKGCCGTVRKTDISALEKKSFVYRPLLLQAGLHKKNRFETIKKGKLRSRLLKFY
jgi:hypothetical protein